jgi:hypothetical protein
MFTALLITLLIVTSAATVVGTGMYLASQRRKSLPGAERKALPSAASGARLLERTLRDLRAGDIVVYGGRDYLVEGVISYDEDGHRWPGGRIIDGGDTKWLVVGFERIGPTSVRLLRIDEELELAGYPPEALVVGGVRYALDRRGTASARFQGDVGRLPGSDAPRPAETVERCRWWLYEAAGDDTMIVEQWGGEYRALRGQKLSPTVVELIPGS